MNVVSESILVRCQYVAMAVCAAGMLFCWGKSITHLHDPDLLVDRAPQTVRAVLASIQREADANLDDRVGASFPTSVLGPSYGAADLLSAANKRCMERHAGGSGVRMRGLSHHSWHVLRNRSPVPNRPCYHGRTCPGTYLSTPLDNLMAALR